MQTLNVDCDTAFLNAVSTWLTNTSMKRCCGQFEFKAILGDLVRSDYSATVDIVFCPSKFKKLAPRVYCNEPWIRRELDWHCLRDQSKESEWYGQQQMCWVHPAEWLIAHDHRLKRINTVVLEGADWLKNNLTKLLDCHWAGHVLGIKNWRPEWGGWAHGNAGTQELVSEARKRGIPGNWSLVSN